MYQSLLVLGVLFINEAYAQTIPACNATSAKEIIKCSVINDPEASRAKLTSESFETLPAKFNQLSNPEIDIDSLHGSGKSETELSITQSFDIGGKKSATAKVAQAQKEEAFIDYNLVKLNVLSNSYLKLQRLRQIEVEKSTLSEISQAINKSLVQLRNRSALSPEQQVSQSVYKMALSDLRIKETELFEEEQIIEQYFSISTGQSLAKLKSVLPDLPIFPDVSDQIEVTNSPVVLKAMSFSKTASFELEEAQSEPWPALKIGPVFKREKEGDEVENSFGVKLTMDLPIFNLNSASKAHATSNLIRWQKIVQKTHQEESSQRLSVVKVYRKSIETLKQIPTLQELQKIHQISDNLEKRGLISSALLIESLRQRMEIIRGRHALELKAVESLLSVYKIDGKNLEELI